MVQLLLILILPYGANDTNMNQRETLKFNAERQRILEWDIGELCL